MAKLIISIFLFSNFFVAHAYGSSEEETTVNATAERIKLLLKNSKKERKNKKIVDRNLASQSIEDKKRRQEFENIFLE